MASTTIPYTVAPLGAGVPFGATVTGLRRQHLPDPSIRQAIQDLWITHGVLLFRGGDSSQEMQLELSRCFGPLEPHPFPETATDSHPELVKIKFYPEDGTFYDVNGELRGGWLSWHCDLIYTSRINHGGILRPVELPHHGGETGFIDRIAAYERLPRQLQERIADLHIVYEVEVNMALHRFSNSGKVELKRFARSGHAIETRKFSYPRVIHPMVYEQAETGRKVLNVSPAFALGIYELGGPDGDALLHEIVSICTSPDLAYFHAWQPGDMVLWDNWRTLHSAKGVPPGETRVMERTTIAGDYALGRVLDGGRKTADFDI